MDKTIENIILTIAFLILLSIVVWILSKIYRGIKNVCIYFNHFYKTIKIAYYHQGLFYTIISVSCYLISHLLPVMILGGFIYFFYFLIKGFIPYAGQITGFFLFFYILKCFMKKRTRREIQEEEERERLQREYDSWLY